MAMVTASPAVAHARPLTGDEWAPVSLSAIKVQVAATLGIRNYKSGHFLQPAGGSSANGAPVVQALNNQNVASQHWILVPDGDYYSFENAASRKNLGIDRASTDPGAGAIQANPAGHYNQDWILRYDARYPQNIFALYNRKSGLCLGIPNASTQPGKQAAQYPCDGSANQGWGLHQP
ncbi:RICIN domain-containing protein [Nonomuraea sp. NPDC050451]|uniref:RICIN domain-containing protein n=1 Tax=Nonomuraea sp. NPDC050451 TaxID=3364364 RepID=UPI003795B0D8